MKLSEILGPHIIRTIEEGDIAKTLPFAKDNLYHLDSSFYDFKDRVKMDYIQNPEFKHFYDMTLDELAAITKPSPDYRTAILGYSSYLHPYMAYSIKFVESNKINIETGERDILPFIIYAPVEWNIEDNLHTIDLLTSLFKEHKLRKIVMIVPTDKSKWFKPNGEMRVIVRELYRLYKNMGDIDVNILDEGDASRLVIVIENKNIGGRRSQMSKGQKARFLTTRTRRKRRSRSRLFRGSK